MADSSEDESKSRSASPEKSSRPGSKAKDSDNESTGSGKGKNVNKGRNRKLKVAPKSTTEMFTKQAVVEAPTKYKKLKFSKIKMAFKMTDGTTKDHFIENREINTYLQVQQEICKIFPHSKSMWMVQTTEGKMLSAANFLEKQVYNIREIASRRLESMKFIPTESPYWEFQDYHAAPKTWKMPKPKVKKVVVIDATQGINSGDLNAENAIKPANSIFSKKEPP